MEICGENVSKKRIADWFEMLPGGYRELALEYAKRDYEVNDMFNALAAAFLWGVTPQGHYFWAEVGHTFDEDKPFTKEDLDLILIKHKFLQ